MATSADASGHARTRELRARGAASRGRGSGGNTEREKGVSKKRVKAASSARRRRARDRRSAFSIGDKVRVRRGVVDPDYPDLALGGWAGTVRKVETHGGKPGYLVEWSKATLDAIHPVFKHRCERDGMDHGMMQLGEKDLEPDDGRREPIEKAHPVPRPLRRNDPEDCWRVVFGLTSDDPVPKVSDESQLAYHRYLATEMRLPFAAVYRQWVDTFEWNECEVTVTDLVRPAKRRLTDDHGLFCRVREGTNAFEVPLAQIKVKGRGKVARLIADYTSWLFECLP